MYKNKELIEPINNIGRLLRQQSPDVPESGLWVAVIIRAIQDAIPTARFGKINTYTARKYLCYDLEAADLLGLEREWVQKVLMTCKFMPQPEFWDEWIKEV